MATLAGEGNSYTYAGTTSVGRQNREDLSDFITNISPTDTPFISGIGQVSAKAVLHEWLSDTLAAASAANVVVEGNDATFVTPTTVTRITNVCQINQKSVAVSGTQDTVAKAGMGKQLAYEVLKRTKEIKRDMESAALNNTAGDFTIGGSTTARVIKGMPAYVTTNTATVTVTATQADISTQVQACWLQGGNPDTIIVNGANKVVISGFTTGVTKNLDANDRRLTTAVDVYETDFNIMRVVPDRFTTTTTVKIVESDLWKVAMLRPLMIEPLAKTGDTTKRLLTAEWTLESRQELGNAILTTP